MVTFPVSEENRVGPFPLEPWAIQIDGLTYQVSTTTGINWLPGEKVIAWDPSFRGFPLPVGKNVTVIFQQPSTMAMSMAPQAQSSSSAGCTPSLPNIDASSPRRVIIDGNTIEERGVSESIEADRYNRSSAALASGQWLHHQQYRPGGATGARPRFTG